MPCGVEAAVGAYEYVVSKNDFSSIKDYWVVVCKEVPANVYVVPIVAPEWCHYAEISFGCSQ